jgi:UDP-N-acetylglucosamine 2-epimerase (non-hydrolysing)
MVDVLLNYLHIAEEKSNILEKLGVSSKDYILLTFHREKNTEDIHTLNNIVSALLRLRDFKIVFPTHPRTEKALKETGLFKKIENSKNILATPPLNYLDFVKLENNAIKIMTDSGGVQKEAYVLGIPCITLRDATECTETVQEGWNLLVAVCPEKIVNAVRNFAPEKKSARKALGDGKAAIKIASILLENLGGMRKMTTSRARA